MGKSILHTLAYSPVLVVRRVPISCGVKVGYEFCVKMLFIWMPMELQQKLKGEYLGIGNTYSSQFTQAP